MNTATQITITEEVEATMAHANLGPKYAADYDATISLTGEHHLATRTEIDADGDTIERQIWQAAHDATDLPEGW